MIFVPSYIDELEPYKPGKSSDIETFSRYKAIICSNENNLGPSPLAIRAIQEQAHTVHFYPDPQGEKLVDKLSQKHNRSSDEIVLSNGLDGLLYTMFKAFTVPGDHVISSENSFVAFNKFAKMNSVSLDLVPMTAEYRFDLEEMLNRIKKQTRIVYLCNPNNPTGTAVLKTELESFIQRIPDHVLLVVDEAYFEFARAIDPDFPDTIALKFPNVLSLRTLSKIYGLAGLRIGYGVSSPKVIEALKKVKLVFNPNVLAQVGAIAGLDDHDHLKRTLKNNSKWNARIVKILESKGYRLLKSYTNFVTMVFPSKEEANSFNSAMDEEGILLRKLDAFGMPNAIRLSIGNEEEMRYVECVLKESPELPSSLKSEVKSY